jgi:UDP-3-O-[3-hydroxymyristoyl] N-acetylglucosamine deacetylase
MLAEMGIALQRTVGEVSACRGIGLHCGQPVAMTLRPAPPDSGIVFRRLDAGAEIRANWASTAESALSTVLSNGEGIQIGTIEHLMRRSPGTRSTTRWSSWMAPVPIMDGSAAPFMLMIERAGPCRRTPRALAVKILKPVSVSANGASALLLPGHGPSMALKSISTIR